MSMFKKMFPPDEVKKVLAALNLCESRFSACIFAFGIVRQKAEQIILDAPDRVIHAIRVLSVAPQDAAIVNIMEAAYDCLLSGDYHIRRGYLTPLGTEIWQMSEIAMKLLTESGYMKQNEADKYRADVSEAINGSG